MLKKKQTTVAMKNGDQYISKRTNGREGGGGVVSDYRHRENNNRLVCLSASVANGLFLI